MAPVPGNSQSPINFCQQDITFIERLPKIEFSYPPTDVTLVNNGSPGEFATIRADVPAGAAHILLDGVRYDLQQFHWHTPSEHEIETRDTPLEMHLVHHEANQLVNPATLVLAIFIDQGKASRALGPIFQNLPQHPGGTHIVPGVRLKGLLPTTLSSFRYSGSLTTPPFTQPVGFIVFAHPITLSVPQIDAFQKLFPDGNSREVQPLNGREILSDADEIFNT